MQRELSLATKKANNTKKTKNTITLIKTAADKQEQEY
jgi:hypothetical protein